MQINVCIAILTDATSDYQSLHSDFITSYHKQWAESRLAPTNERRRYKVTTSLIGGRKPRISSSNPSSGEHIVALSKDVGDCNIDGSE